MKMAKKDKDRMIERARELGMKLYKCPNTGDPILEVDPSDDKVLCNCGKPNPKLNAVLAGIEQRCHGHLVSHLDTI